MPDEPPKRKLIPPLPPKKESTGYTWSGKRDSVHWPSEGRRRFMNDLYYMWLFFWPSFSWSTVCVLGEWERGWKLSPSWNSLYHILAQQDCVSIQLGKAIPQEIYIPLGCGVSGLRASVGMVWKLQGYQPIGSGQAWRKLSSRQAAAVLNRNHKGAQWT